MSDTYISQRAIIDIPIPYLSERKEYLSANEHEIYEQGYQDALDKAATLPPADVVQVETLQAKISELKYQMDCRTPNIDYYTGYMSALSTVEGILAVIREE